MAGGEDKRRPCGSEDCNRSSWRFLFPNTHYLGSFLPQSNAASGCHSTITLAYFDCPRVGKRYHRPLSPWQIDQLTKSSRIPAISTVTGELTQLTKVVREGAVASRVDIRCLPGWLALDRLVAGEAPLEATVSLLVCEGSNHIFPDTSLPFAVPRCPSIYSLFLAAAAVPLLTIASSYAEIL